MDKKFITSRKRRYILIYPIFFALFPALSLYVYNLQQVQFSEVVWSILLIFMSALLIWFGLQRLVRVPHKPAIITTIFIIFFFSYGHVIRAASYLLNALGMLSTRQNLVRGEFADVLWLLICTGMIIFFTFVIVKYQKDLEFASQVLNVCSIVALSTVLFNWILFEYRQPADKIQKFITQWISSLPYKVSSNTINPQGTLPDIYYIILDGMGSEDVLKDYYQANISKFHTYLAQKGFYIADQSRSNYAWTELSLASSLNFMYLDGLRSLGPDTSDITPLEIMVEKNLLFNILRAHGYRIITFSDEYPLTNITSADAYLAPQRWVINAFQYELINTTPLPALFRVLSSKTPYDFHRDHVLFMFENLVPTQKREQPSFIFAHFMVPHPPFVFGSHGESLSSDAEFSFNFGIDKAGGKDKYIAGYRDQVDFVTTRIMPELDKILVNSSRPALVIIQGDHGPGLNLDWNSLDNTDLNERMSIFNAYYFFDKNYRHLSPDLSPVNTFRVILNQYFDMELPLLANKSYFTRVYRPYDFIEVTGRLIKEPVR